MIPSGNSSVAAEDQLKMSIKSSSTTSSSFDSTPLQSLGPNSASHISDPHGGSSIEKHPKYDLANLGLNIVGMGLTTNGVKKIKKEHQDVIRIPSSSTDSAYTFISSPSIDYEFLNFDINEPPSSEIVESIFEEFLHKRSFTNEAKMNLKSMSIQRKWRLICQEHNLIHRDNTNNSNSNKNKSTDAVWFASHIRQLNMKDLHKLERLLRGHEFIEEFLLVDGHLKLIETKNNEDFDEDKKFLIISCFKNIVNLKKGTDLIVQNVSILVFLVDIMFNSQKLLNKKLLTDILVLLSYWSPPLGRNNLLKAFNKVSKLNLFEKWMSSIEELLEEDHFAFNNIVLKDLMLSSLFLIISICEGAESINDKKIIHSKFKEAAIYSIFHKMKLIGDQLIDEQIERYKSMEQFVFSNDILAELNLTDSRVDMLFRSIRSRIGSDEELLDLNAKLFETILSIYETSTTSESAKILKLLNQIIQHLIQSNSRINENSESVMNIAIQQLMDQLTTDDITRRAMHEVKEYELKTGELEKEITLLKESLELSNGDILKQNNELQLKIESKDKTIEKLEKSLDELQLVRNNEKAKYDKDSAVISFTNAPISKRPQTHQMRSESLLRSLSKRSQTLINHSSGNSSPPLSRNSSISRSKSTVSLVGKFGIPIEEKGNIDGESSSKSSGSWESVNLKSGAVSNIGSNNIHGTELMSKNPFIGSNNPSNLSINSISGSQESLAISSGTNRSTESIVSSNLLPPPPPPALPEFLKSSASLASSSNTISSSNVSSIPLLRSLKAGIPGTGSEVSLPPPPPALPDFFQQRANKSAPELPIPKAPPLPPSLSSTAQDSSVPPPPPPPSLPDFLVKPKASNSAPAALPPPPPPAPPLPGAAKSDSKDGPPPPPPLPTMLSLKSNPKSKKAAFKPLSNILTQKKIDEISKSLHRPSKKLKQLHWEKIDKVDQTLWGESTHSRTDELMELGILKEVEDLFTIKETKKKVSPSSATAKTDKITFLPRDLSQQFGINLHMFSNFTEEQLISKVIKCDYDVLNNISVLEFFNKDELNEIGNGLLRNFKPYSTDFVTGSKPEKDVTVLERSDRIFLELCYNLRFYWRSRSRALLMIKTYEKDYYDLSKRIQTLDDAVKSVKNSKNLKNIFILIREIGNFMNNKPVEGFKLASLQKLNFIKDQNQNTFLQYLEKVIRRAYPEYLKFMEELSSLQDSSKISVEQLSVDIDAYIKTIKSVERSVESGNLSDPKKLHPDDRIVTKVLPRLPEAKRKYQLLEDQQKFVISDFEKLMKYFGENPSDAGSKASFFQKFQEFINDFKRVQKQNHEEEQKIKIYEKRKAMMLMNKKAREESRGSMTTDGESDVDGKQEEDVVDNLLRKLKGVSNERRTSTTTSSRSRNMDQEDTKLLTRAQTLLEGTKNIT